MSQNVFSLDCFLGLPKRNASSLFFSQLPDSCHSGFVYLSPFTNGNFRADSREIPVRVPAFQLVYSARCGRRRMDLTGETKRVRSCSNNHRVREIAFLSSWLRQRA